MHSVSVKGEGGGGRSSSHTPQCMEEVKGGNPPSNICEEGGDIMGKGGSQLPASQKCRDHPLMSESDYPLMRGTRYNPLTEKQKTRDHLKRTPPRHSHYKGGGHSEIYSEFV